MSVKKLHFISLGCPKNLVDSEVMIGMLNKAGFALSAEAEGADVAIVNTCAFIADAKQESIDAILEMGELKKKKKLKMIVVVGCLPQRYEKELAELIPEVDIFIGTGEFQKIVDIIKNWDGSVQAHVGEPTYIYDHNSERFHSTPSHYAYLKVAEGCFHLCSFCIIPKVRGDFRSRPSASIVEEARAMISRGVREINLIAQDTTGYGRDIGENLPDLLEKIARIEGSKWLRVMYSHPATFDDKLIAAMKNIDDVCAYADIPIQHINNRVLKRMGRRTKGDDVRRLLEKLRSEIPRVSLRTSLIVGFPGETDEEFEELLDFVSEVKFEHLGVFEFSPEEGTPAAKLDGLIEPKISAERRNTVMDLQREISLSNNQRFVGKRIVSLVSGASSESNMLLEARHEGQAPDVDGVIYINDGIAAQGDFAVVEITEAHEYDLVGKVVG